MLRGKDGLCPFLSAEEIAIRAKDKHHDAVVNALKKDGWIIANEQLHLAIDTQNLWFFRTLMLLANLN